MAYELYTRTNQKIYYAGLALTAWQKAIDGRALNAQALIQAERESSLFHLYGALLGLCHEIAGFYHIAGASAPRVELLLNKDVLAAAPSPEMAELVELAVNPQTWLAQLLTAYAGLFTPPQAPKKAKLDPTLPLITAVSLDEEVPELSREQLEAWRRQLKELALRFRESLSEC
ncbi:MAG: PasA protein [Pseudomonadales bacterium RIFCSPLOWO2_12_59_9]|nr:MAG: PasA protein [Pseudomonadales bacterium RIFCSPLOWO2_12_59_9]